MLVRALCAVLLAVIALAGLSTATTASHDQVARSGACAAPQRCGQPRQSAAGKHDVPAIPCLRDAGCGGGLLAFAGAALVVAVLPTAARVAATPRPRTRLSHVATSLASLLTAGRLYRPPRFSA